MECGACLQLLSSASRPHFSVSLFGVLVWDLKLDLFDLFTGLRSSGCNILV